MAFYVIFWSIWLLRNDMVFNGKVFDFEYIIDTIKFCLTSWFKAKWPDCPNTVLDVVKFHMDIQVQMVCKAIKKTII
ncbi:hypothetical protein CRYUN_Cryun40dG0065000 [Craigia yunnanensis]